MRGSHKALSAALVVGATSACSVLADFSGIGTGSAGAGGGSDGGTGPAGAGPGGAAGAGGSGATSTTDTTGGATGSGGGPCADTFGLDPSLQVIGAVPLAFGLAAAG